MRTMQLQQTDSAAKVAKHHQFLAEDLDPMRQVLQFVGEADRLPKAAQIFAAWCVGADMREFGVFPGHLTMEVAAKSCRQETGSGDHRSRPFSWGNRPVDQAATLAEAPSIRRMMCGSCNKLRGCSSWATSIMARW